MSKIVLSSDTEDSTALGDESCRPEGELGIY